MNIDLRNNPPTAAAINTARTRTRLEVVAWTVVLIIVVNGCFYLSDNGQPDVNTVLSVFVSICVSLAAVAVDAGLQALYAPVAAEACDKLLKACLSTPEGIAYRQLVLDKRREFIVLEFNAVKEWAEGAAERASRAALYDPGYGTSKQAEEAPPQSNMAQ